ncbi:MAG: FtsX-like permease family protein [Coriobacteriia bacterium]|nr:FtsX-like permease family protein [Coriobacteriia bacterium]
MTLLHLALKDISRNAFRSWAIFLCALLVAGLALATLLITRGAQDSLELAVDRLGADIIVVPQGSETTVESALLMGTPTQVWMPEERIGDVRNVDGVSQASSQLYLTSLKNAACCSVENMFMVAYDPETDFTIQPWLEKNLGGGLSLGEVVGGTFVFVPEGEQNIKLYNYLLTLKANLEPTGSNLDQSMFLTLETARDMSRMSRERAEEPLVIPEGKISAILVKVADGADPDAVAVQILKDVPGVTPVVSPKMFGTFRDQMSAALSSMVLVLSLTLGLSLVFIALVFSMATHERRREIGVLRALGASRAAVVRSLLVQAVILTCAGAVIGAVLAAIGIYLFRDYIVTRVGFPFLFPSLSGLFSFLMVGLAIALCGVLLAVVAPAVRVSRQDPAHAMRE